jgi:predicted nucleic acid-binding Zn ribbon protein
MKNYKCHHCGEELTFTNGYAEEIFFYCENKNCSAYMLQQLPVSPESDYDGINKGLI